MLGMIFGVGAVIAMLSIGAGAERESLRIIENFGIRNIIIQAKEFKTEELRQIRTESLGLALRDVEALEVGPARPNRWISAKRVVKTFQVISETGRSDSRVLGVSSTYPDDPEPEAAAAAPSSFPSTKMAANQVCVLGITAKQKLFGFGDVLGQKIKVNDQWLTRHRRAGRRQRGKAGIRRGQGPESQQRHLHPHHDLDQEVRHGSRWRTSSTKSSCRWPRRPICASRQPRSTT